MTPRKGLLQKDLTNENSNRKHIVSDELVAFPERRAKFSENLLCLVLATPVEVAQELVNLFILIDIFRQIESVFLKQTSKFDESCSKPKAVIGRAFAENSEK